MRTIVPILIYAAVLTAADYRHPIVFGRGHNNENGKPMLHSKIWIMEEDGSNQRQLTRGETL
jgi:hypothetical protein